MAEKIPHSYCCVEAAEKAQAGSTDVIQGSELESPLWKMERYEVGLIIFG